jgi:membrane-bound ClpP family serine protease
VLVLTAGLVGCFFAFVVVKALALRRMPPASEARSIVGDEGVAIGTGVTPEGGLVRVRAEEWQAVTGGGEIAAGAPVRVTRLDGLVLTVEPAPLEHDPAGAPDSDRAMERG